MDKKEKILQLQQSVLSMREDMGLLKEKLGHMLQGLEAEELLEEGETEVLEQQMKQLLASQETFLKECDTLQFTNMETSLLSWENVLAEQLKDTEKDVYREVIDFVLRLQVLNAGMEKYLEELRTEVQGLDVNAMSEETLAEALQKYMLLEQAFFEEDQKKRFMQVLSLGSSFNTEFLYCINSGELTLVGMQPAEDMEAEVAATEEQVTVEKETEEAEETEAEETEAEVAAIIAELVEEVEAEIEEAESEPEAVSEEIEEGVELDSVLLRQAMIFEDGLNFIEEESEKERINFQIREFHTDVCGSSERRKCMSKAFELHGVTPRLMANIMGKSELLFEGACSSLFRNGYFRRYSISGYEPFYYLSKKGYEAFKNAEAMEYLQGEIQQDDTAFCRHDSLSVLTWHCIEAAMNYIHEEKSDLNCTYEIVKMQKNAFSIAFTYGAAGVRKKLMMAGIASEQERDFQALLGGIRGYTETVDSYVVYGLNEEQARAAAELVAQAAGTQMVAYTIGDSELYYDLETGVLVDIFCDEPEEEEIRPEEVQEVDEPDIAADLDVEEDTDDAADLDVEEDTDDAAESDEEIDIEIPTIMLDMQTVGSLTQSEEEMEEENPFSYRDIYCQMICDGRSYCATAYLKAAAEEDSEEGAALQAEYRQLAYAVNDPMEMCSYTADKLSAIYLSGTANICYFVSAVLRCLFFDHETDTQKLRQILPVMENAELLKMHGGIKRLINIMLSYKEENQVSIGHYGAGAGADKTVRDDAVAVLDEIISELGINGNDGNQPAGNVVLRDTLAELKSRLKGSYTKQGNKYFYIGFLAGDEVLLDDGFMPILEEVISSRPSPQGGGLAAMLRLLTTERIVSHSKKAVDTASPVFFETLKQRLDSIVNNGGDFSAARNIMKYIKEVHPEKSDAIYGAYNLDIAASKAKNAAKLMHNRFIGNLELCQKYGSVDMVKEKEAMLWIADRWYNRTEETLDFGFFKKILQAFNEKAGDDLLRPLQKGDVVRNYESGQESYLKDFCEAYENIYANVRQAGYTLQMLLERSGIYQACPEGRCLADNWLKNFGNAGEERVCDLMLVLGFMVDGVSQQQPIEDKLENYLVMLKKRSNKKDNYTHPIAAFGSQAEKEGFGVVCLYGMQDADSLVEIFEEIGNTRNCLLLLDYALPMAERRGLAKKVKQVSNGRICAVLDRVILIYLMQHYAKGEVNKMLMALTMPFTACEPYVVDFSKGMPQEICIGRSAELAQIQAPDGVSIVYGGRHLGKSALLRMARRAVDCDENHNRAVLINVKGMNFRRAVKNVYKEMCREGILAEGKDVEDWGILAALIGARLEQEQDYIPYLLLLLDEADAFLKSCSVAAYAPIAELEKLQFRYQGRFKFVVAGLKNVIRFEETVETRKNSVFPMLKSLVVKPFKYEEARELLEVPLSYLGFSFPEKEQTEAMISTVFRTTHYFPGMLQLYCSMLLNPEDVNQMYSEKNAPPYEMREGHMKRVLADGELHRRIKEELRATLRVDDEGYYHMIALLAALWQHGHESREGCDAGDIFRMAEQYGIARIQALGGEQVETLMQEMRKLNIFRQTGTGKYHISDFGFYQLMGTEEEVKNKLAQYVTSV